MKYAFFDVDYTLYDSYLSSDFSDFLVAEGHVPKTVAEEEKALKKAFVSGEIGYREAVERALQIHAACIKDRSVQEVEVWGREFITRQDRLFPWVREGLKHLKEQGYAICLISASPITALEPVAEIIGADKVFGTALTIQNGIYTGGVETILNYEEKHRLVESLVTKTLGDFHVGFGDSAGDVDMLSHMDKAVLHEPKGQELLNLAAEKGWEVTDRNGMLQVIHIL